MNPVSKESKYHPGTGRGQVGGGRRSHSATPSSLCVRKRRSAQQPEFGRGRLPAPVPAVARELFPNAAGGVCLSPSAPPQNSVAPEACEAQPRPPFRERRFPNTTQFAAFLPPAQLPSPRFSGMGVGKEGMTRSWGWGARKCL